MYEYHGWATIAESYLNEDNFDERLREVAERIEAKMESIGAGNGFYELRAVNGYYHLHISGLNNHKGCAEADILGLYEFIAMTARGSYGLLFIHDDEDENGEDNEFRVYVLAKGKLSKKKDAFLSPYIPNVEEP